MSKKEQICVICKESHPIHGRGACQKCYNAALKAGTLDEVLPLRGSKPGSVPKTETWKQVEPVTAEMLERASDEFVQEQITRSQPLPTRGVPPMAPAYNTARVGCLVPVIDHFKPVMELDFSDHEDLWLDLQASEVTASHVINLLALCRSGEYVLKHI